MELVQNIIKKVGDDENLTATEINKIQIGREVAGYGIRSFQGNRRFSRAGIIVTVHARLSAFLGNDPINRFHIAKKLAC